MFHTMTKEQRKSFFTMLLSVALMGFSLSLLVLTNLGTDPCSSMNYGISKCLGISFGNYQIIFNLILLLFVFAFYRSCIGLGTLGNMIVVGYTADFFSYVWKNLCHVPDTLSFPVRICILIPALCLFVVAAAYYMHSGHGMGAYDAIPFIISQKLDKKNPKKEHFKIVRLSQDFICSLIGLATGGEFGVITILMVITLAPTVEFVGNRLKKT